MNKIILISAIIVLSIAGVLVLNQNKNTNNNSSQNSISVSPSLSQSPSITQVVSPTAIQVSSTVPLPTQEDVIRTFFNLINEKRISEAVLMMSQKAIGDDSNKQAWGVQLASLTSAKVEKIEKVEGDTYRVDFLATIDPKNKDLPIPYYGYDDGSNTRFITLLKENNLWKIEGLATGP